MPDDDLTPEEEQVRRLLADARHTEPMPADVAARLDEVLAGLPRDAPGPGPLQPAVADLDAAPAPAPRPHLAGRRRRGRRRSASASTRSTGPAISSGDDAGGSATPPPTRASRRRRRRRRGPAPSRGRRAELDCAAPARGRAELRSRSASRSSGSRQARARPAAAATAPRTTSGSACASTGGDAVLRVCDVGTLGPGELVPVPVRRRARLAGVPAGRGRDPGGRPVPVRSRRRRPGRSRSRRRRPARAGRTGKIPHLRSVLLSRRPRPPSRRARLHVRHPHDVRNVIIIGSGPSGLHRRALHRPRQPAARWSSRAR